MNLLGHAQDDRRAAIDQPRSVNGDVLVLLPGRGLPTSLKSFRNRARSRACGRRRLRRCRAADSTTCRRVSAPDMGNSAFARRRGRASDTLQLRVAVGHPFDHRAGHRAGRRRPSVPKTGWAGEHCGSVSAIGGDLIIYTASASTTGKTRSRPVTGSVRSTFGLSRTQRDLTAHAHGRGAASDQSRTPPGSRRSSMSRSRTTRWRPSRGLPPARPPRGPHRRPGRYSITTGSMVGALYSYRGLSLQVGTCTRLSLPQDRASRRFHRATLSTHSPHRAGVEQRLGQA